VILDIQHRILIKVNASIYRYGLKAAMPFGTQYGYPPLPVESDAVAAWQKVAPHVDILIGTTSHELAFFLPGIPKLAALLRIPGVGRLNRRMIVRSGTPRSTVRLPRKFANGHRAAGGTAYQYTLTFGARRDVYASGHSIDLPLLFPNQKVWDSAALVAGRVPDQLDAAGRHIREIWADFARTGHVHTGSTDNLITVAAD
jgi:para-nitrobenzyl esterase